MENSVDLPQDCAAANKEKSSIVLLSLELDSLQQL